MFERGIVRAGKWIILVISNEDTDEIARIIKLLENSSVLIDGVSKTVTHQLKRQEERCLGILLETSGASVLYVNQKSCNESRKRLK